MKEEPSWYLKEAPPRGEHSSDIDQHCFQKALALVNLDFQMQVYVECRCIHFSRPKQL